MFNARLNWFVFAVAAVIVASAAVVLFYPGSGPESNISPATTSTLLPGLVEVAYDDGVFESEFSLDEGMTAAVLFTPPSYPFIVHGVKYFIPMDPAPVSVHLFSGAPPAGDLTPRVQYNSIPGWSTVYFERPYEIEAGGVFVGVTALAASTTRIACDASEPVRGKTWIMVDGSLLHISELAGASVDAGVRLLGEVVTTTSTTSTSTSSTTTSTSSTTTSSSTTTTIDIKEFNLTFRHWHGECGKTGNLTVSAENNSIFFWGYARTPTPCYMLNVSSTASENTVTLRLSGVQETRVCVFCRAAVPFAGVIRGLPVAGEYRLVVNLVDGSSVVETVYLNLTPVVETPIECETKADCGVDYYGSFVCVSDKPKRPFYRHLCVKGRCVVRSDVEVEVEKTCKELGLI